MLDWRLIPEASAGAGRLNCTEELFHSVVGKEGREEPGRCGPRIVNRKLADISSRIDKDVVRGERGILNLSGLLTTDREVDSASSRSLALEHNRTRFDLSTDGGNRGSFDLNCR